MTTVALHATTASGRAKKFYRAILVCVAAASGFMVDDAHAQTMGIATMQPGTINHTTGAAIAKVLKEKAGFNVLLQPTAGESVIIPMVARGEADFGMANAPEIGMALASGGQPDLRLIGAIYPLRTAFFVRKDSPMKTVADLRGRRVTLGFSAMRAVDTVVRAMLATGGLSEKDVKVVLVPNVIRSADDFASGAADMFYFAFGAPKVREVDVTVGGTRVLDIPDSPGMEAARKISPYGYLTEVKPSPAFTGVENPIKSYTVDNLMFANAKVPNEVVYKVLDALVNNKDELVVIAPPLREFSAADLHKRYEFPYHPGALKYFNDKNIAARAIQ